MKARWTTILLPMLLLAPGCMSDEQVGRNAAAEAKMHCEGEGRQFIYRDRRVVNDDSMFGRSMIVWGDCVGPGDPGYVPPPKP